MIRKLLLTACLLACCSGTVGAQENYFSDWPAGVAPETVGKSLAEHFVTSPHQGSKTIVYPEVCAWYGALTFANVAHDEALRQELIKRFEPLMPDGAEAERRPQRRQVDDSIFGVVPLEIARQTKDPRYLKEGFMVGGPPVGESAAGRAFGRDAVLDR